MRLWSIHPKYLDSKGLVALWRESLLAQAVLLNRTKGYRSHPQLIRFRAQPDPPASIGHYLHVVARAAAERGYCFQAARIVNAGDEVTLIPVTDGQLRFERDHLVKKLLQRDPARLVDLPDAAVQPHPLFYVVPGKIEAWERS